MMAEMTDSEILEFLMTSDFNEDITPEEARFLLLKFRYFFRLKESKSDGLKNKIIDLEEKNRISEENSNMEKFNLQLKNAKLEEIVNKFKNRKLTLIERITGKLKIEN